MRNKRRNRSRALPTRQCKKAKIATNLRTSRNGINYDESGYDILDYLDESEIITKYNGPISTDTAVEDNNYKAVPKITIKVTPSTIELRNKTGKSTPVGTDKMSISSRISTRSVVSNSGSDNISNSRLPCPKRCSIRKSKNGQKKEIIFIVDKVLDMRYVDGVREFFLKWEGFPNSENSWEPEEFIDSKDIITEFLEELEKNKNPGSGGIIPAPTKDDSHDVIHENEIGKTIKEDSSNESVLESINENKIKLRKKMLDPSRKKLGKKKKSKKKFKQAWINKIKMKLRNGIEINVNNNARETLPIISGEIGRSGNEEENEVDRKGVGKEIEGTKKKKLPGNDKGNMSRCSHSDKENDIAIKERREESDDDDDDDNEDESEEEEKRKDIDDAKSESSDEDFNAESRKKSKITQNNLNVYFPENLPQTVQEIFQVEKILRMRWSGGVRYFYLKWEGFPDTENSWEPEANLECPELIEEFLNDLRKPAPKKIVRRKQEKKSMALETLPEEVKIKEPAVRPRGFPKSREAEVILGSGIINNELNFLIKWKNVDMANIVPARRANIECPQTVIRFYENNLTWQNMDGSLTTEPKEKIDLEEETGEEKRARIALKKEQRKFSLQSPRKVGRPCTSQGLLQARKLTSGASRMLNIINNFQTRKPPVPVSRRPIPAVPLPPQPKLATPVSVVDDVTSYTDPSDIPSCNYEPREMPNEPPSSEPDFPAPVAQLPPAVHPPMQPFSPSAQNPPFSQNNIHSSTTSQQSLGRHPNATLASRLTLANHLHSAPNKHRPPQSSIFANHRSLPQQVNITPQTSKQQLQNILANSLQRSPRKNLQQILSKSYQNSPGIIAQNCDQKQSTANTQQTLANNGGSGSLNQQLQQILASSFQNSPNMTLNQQLQHILANSGHHSPSLDPKPAPARVAYYPLPASQSHMQYVSQPAQYVTPPSQPAQFATPTSQPGQYATPPSQFATPTSQPGQYATPPSQFATQSSQPSQYLYHTVPATDQLGIPHGQAVMYQSSQQYSPVQYQYMPVSNSYQQTGTINQPTNQQGSIHAANQMFYTQQQANNAQSPRTILPRISEFSTAHNNQTSAQQQNNNQILRNSYLNLGAFL